MTLEAPRVPEDALGSLRGCLVEGDPQSERRVRRSKRRAIAISVLLQTIALTALVLYPLLTKGERITLQYVTPVPPYAPVGDIHHSTARHRSIHSPAVYRVYPTRYMPGRIVMHDPIPVHEPTDQEGDPIPGLLPAPGVHGGYTPTISRPEVPREETHARVERRSVSGPLQMALLINRVEPIYPALAIDTHREGRVELHAIISTEGKIESLEVISGDPFFIQSALSAVRQWRYRPTILNGRPVEIDTHITVIYTLSH